MARRGALLVTIITLVGVTYGMAAQDTGCQIDLASATDSLAKAQQALDGGDTEAALKAVSLARSALQLLEAGCQNFAPDTAGNSRSNPVPFGQRQHAVIDTLGSGFSGSLQVIEYIDDANDYVLQANSRNEPAPAGARYIVFRLNFACERTPDEMCEFSRIQFSSVGDQGLVYEWDSQDAYDIRVRNIGEDQEIFGGAEIEIDLSFVVDASDTNFVLFTKFGDPPVFFASS